VDERHLLILDLDETLVHATRQPLDYAPVSQIGPYAVYLRPGVQDFLESIAGHFRLAVWTSSSATYAEAIVAMLFADASALEFVWSRERCTPRRDFERDVWVDTKSLHKVKRRGYDLRKVVVVDDTPQKYARSYGNLVIVRPFEGDRADDELTHLAPYLQRLAKEPDVRRIEKRGWRRSNNEAL
jgi:RNA polymerase II subunit A small phosphatase-like protein